jgi:hypothetical protein
VNTCCELEHWHRTTHLPQPTFFKITMVDLKRNFWLTRGIRGGVPAANGRQGEGQQICAWGLLMGEVMMIQRGQE